VRKFKDAFNGLREALRHKAVLVQFILMLITLIVCFLLEFAINDLIIVLLCCCVVIAFEIINFAIEKLCDFICEARNEKIKIIKDASAAAVLVASSFSLIIGILILSKYWG